MTPAVLIVPGIRGDAPEHWQTLLAARLPNATMVPPMGKGALDCERHIEALERAARAAAAPLVVVAHSAGVVTTVRWARHTRCQVLGALLAVPPDLEHPLPEGYPAMEALRDGGWLPLPSDPLPFPSIVAASRNDPLAAFGRVEQMAQAWGSRLVDLGQVGHLNPASGFGPWPEAQALMAEWLAMPSQATQD